MPQQDVDGTLEEVRRLLQKDLMAAGEQARVLYEGARTAVDQIQAGVLLVSSLSRTGELEEAERLLSRLSVAASGSPGLEGVVLCQFAEFDGLRGRLTDMLRWAAQARERACEVGDRHLEARSLSFIAEAYGALGAHEESMQQLVDALLIWQRIGQPAPAEALDQLAGLYHRLGRPEDAIAVARRCLERCVKDGDLRMEARARGTHAQCLRALGRHDEAVADLRVGRDLFAALGNTEAVIHQDILLGGLLGEQGRTGEAAELLRRGQEALAAQPSPRLEAHFLAAQARLAELTGEDAVAQLGEALTRFEALKMGAEVAETHEGLYRIHKRAGRWREALAHHEALVSVRSTLLSARSEARLDALRVRYEVTRLEQERRISRLRNIELAAAYQRLQKLVTQDAVTGLHNRRHLDNRLTEEVQRARRYSRDLSLLLFDIDRFKNINDQLGHLAGDRVLREVARLVQSSTREVDIVARYGGDEFAILFPDTSLSGARKAAEKLRQTIADHDWSDIDPDLSVTISGGVAVLGEGPLMETADRALYASKRSGRDRISG